MMFCSKCGNQFEGKFCSQCGHPVNDSNLSQSFNRISSGKEKVKVISSGTTSFYYITKFVISIISLIMLFLLFFQSYSLLLADSFLGYDTTAGFGLLLGAGWLIAGIVNIVGRKNVSATWVCCGLYLLSGTVAADVVNSFADLRIYVGLSYAFAIVFGLAALTAEVE
ncbi:hypothetical protein V6615_16125 [Oscillospiraceae bacterium PP1C4]